MVERHANASPGMALTFRDGLVRALLWPYFVFDQVLFGAIIMAVLTFLVLRSGFEAPIVMIGPAYVGMHVVAFMTSPANLRVA